MVRPNYLFAIKRPENPGQWSDSHVYRNASFPKLLIQTESHASMMMLLAYFAMPAACYHAMSRESLFAERNLQM